MTRCKLCSSEQTKPLFIAQNVHGRHILSKDTFEIYQCASCKATFTSIKVDSTYYNKYYPQDYYFDLSCNILVKKILSFLQEISFRHRLKLIRKYKSKGNRILEIGPGRGEFLYFLPTFFQRYGIEINQIGYEYIKKHYPDIAVFNIRVDDASFKDDGLGKFDAIIMWHVLEHIENPSIFMENLSKLIAQDGVIIFDIPNRDSIGFNLAKSKWFHLDAPRHLFHYNYESIRNLLKKNNLEIISYKGNFIDYFQDLSTSIYLRYKKNSPVLNWLILIIILLPTLIIRFVASLVFPRKSELNTYIVKRKN